MEVSKYFSTHLAEVFNRLELAGVIDKYSYEYKDGKDGEEGSYLLSLAKQQADKSQWREWYSYIGIHHEPVIVHDKGIVQKGDGLITSDKQLSEGGPDMALGAFLQQLYDEWLLTDPDELYIDGTSKVLNDTIYFANRLQSPLHKDGWQVIVNLMYDYGVNIYEDCFNAKIMYKEDGKAKHLSETKRTHLESVYGEAYMVWQYEKKKGWTKRLAKNYSAAFDCFASDYQVNEIKEYLIACGKLAKADGGTYDGAWVIDNVFGKENVTNPDEAAKIFQSWKFANIARQITSSEEGYKHDEAIVLEGNQGCGKSTFCQELSGLSYWVKMPNLTDGNLTKDAMQIQIGKRVIEMDEIGRLTGIKNHNSLKAILSEQKHEIRLPYAKEPRVYPITHSYICTTNDSHYLTDISGNRRFRPIRLLHTETNPINNPVLTQHRELIDGWFYNQMASVEEADWYNSFIALDKSMLQYLRDAAGERLRTPSFHDEVVEFLTHQKNPIAFTMKELANFFSTDPKIRFEKSNAKNIQEVAASLTTLGYVPAVLRSDFFAKGKYKDGACYRKENVWCLNAFATGKHDYDEWKNQQEAKQQEPKQEPKQESDDLPVPF